MRPERIKHIPTGLYYRPSRDIRATVTMPDGSKEWRYVKSNLSKDGKVYLKGATIRWVEGWVSSHLVAKEQLQAEANKGIRIYRASIRGLGHLPYVPEDWVIEPLTIAQK